jgi:type IV pilus assembly protein PilV
VNIRAPNNQSGLILLENLIAMMILIIGILGLLGMQAVMVKNTVDARYRAEAGYIAQKRIAEIWSVPPTDIAGRAALAEQDVDIANASGLPAGRRDTIRGAAESGCDGSPNCYIVVVRWTPPGGTQHNYTIVAHVQ